MMAEPENLTTGVSNTSRWFHPHISGKEAEKLLLNNGYVGSFLVRESRSKPGNYTLSVRREKGIIHVQIQNYGEYYDVSTGSEFASLSELVSYYTEQGNPLKEVNGNLVEAKYPLYNTETPSSDSWFHGNLDTHLAENILKQEGMLNSFLVRERTRTPGEFVLCVLVSKDVVKNIIILCKNGEYFIKASEVINYFNSLSELVEHYKKETITEGSGHKILLGKPVVVGAAPMKPKHQPSKQPDVLPSRRQEKHLEEFEQLQKQECHNKAPRTEGQKQENRERNRYKNILPFDHSRVILRDEPNGYINANYIQISDNRMSYIATQGCLQATVRDFWKMIWQENTQIIVMVTRITENGKNKCARYWPESPENPTIVLVFNGRITISFKTLRNTSSKDYTIREFMLTYEVEKPDVPGEYEETESRTVYHYQYLAWRDKDVPDKPNTVVDMLLTISEHQMLMVQPGPIVVHCSAGIGRTGSLIVLGLIIDELQCKGLQIEVNIKDMVAQIRQQRSGMVQTELQYKFIYDTVEFYINKYATMAATEGEYANICIKA